MICEFWWIYFNFLVWDSILRHTYSKMERSYCCLKKLDQCKTRLERPNIGKKIGNGSGRILFNMYIGDANASIFQDDDRVCQRHNLKIKQIDPKFRAKRQVESCPPPSPKKLKSGTEHGKIPPQESQNNDNADLHLHQPLDLVNNIQNKNQSALYPHKQVHRPPLPEGHILYKLKKELSLSSFLESNR